MNIATTLLVGAFVFGSPAPSTPRAGPQEAQNQTVIVVVGAPGAPEYAAQFAEWAGLWREACARGGARFIAVGLKEEQEPSDRLRLQKALSDESGQTATALWLVLIGHGTFDGRTAKFNLRGPDVSADELAEWLKPTVRPVAVINMASSSAPFLKKLSGPGRVVVTATKSGFEHNYARFGQYIAQAIIEPGADLDKDGQTSLLEAFLTASARVEEFYSAAGRLATEHALLDDNGDTLGTPADWFRGIRPVRRAADDASLDGYRAHQLHILSSDAEAAMTPELRARRDSLELEVMRLRETKETLSEEEYYGRLESLLRQIAEIYRRSETPE